MSFFFFPSVALDSIIHQNKKHPSLFETDDSAVPLKFTVGTVPSQALTRPGEALARHTGDPTRV